MKKARKLITFILTVVMVLSMSMNVWAVDITIENAPTSSEYEAYRLLNATDGGEGKFAYTVNAIYKDVLEEVIKAKDVTILKEEDIINYIYSLSENKKALQEFANAVYKAIKEADPAKDADKISENNVLSGIDQGYYLIAQTQKGDADEASSLIMLDTAGKDGISIEPKDEVPTLEKKITDPDDSTSANGEKNNVSIGDDVEFTLTATIPQEAEYYDYYFCIFSDTLSNGLTLVKDVDGKNLTVKASTNGVLAVDVDYELYLDPNAEDNTFQVALKNAKGLAGQEITVTYWAELNESANIGANGNSNTATLTYSNDPNTQYGDYVDEDDPSGKPEPDPDPDDPNLPEQPPMGDTPERITYTYTTDIKVVKVDKDSNTLTGATFTLNGEGLSKELQVDSNGVLTFKGLGEGTYTITETEPPAGYNAAADITVDIEWNGEKTGDDMWTVKVNDEDASANFENGVLTLTVVNLTGSELPSTGGIGTTIFYIVGGALVLFAVVLLVTKKRMKDTQ